MMNGWICLWFNVFLSYAFLNIIDKSSPKVNFCKAEHYFKRESPVWNLAVMYLQIDRGHHALYISGFMSFVSNTVEETAYMTSTYVRTWTSLHT